MGVPFDRKYQCVVRAKSCGHIFSAKQTVFIATPSPNSVKQEIRTITSILEKYGIKSYVATEEVDPAKEIYCTKICAEIIESKFCIVILTSPLSEAGRQLPNPNVHYEYGLMIGLDKYVIPIQREEQALPFNIHSMDTVKYNDANMLQLFTDAIQVTVDRVLHDDAAKEKIGVPLRSLNLYMEMRGYQKLFDSTITHATHFKAYRHWKYGAICIDKSRLGDLAIQLKLVLSRLVNLVNEKEAQAAMFEKRAATQMGSTGHAAITDKIFRLRNDIRELSDSLEITIAFRDPVCEKEDILGMLRSIGQEGNDKIHVRGLDEISEFVYGKTTAMSKLPNTST